MIPYIQIPPLEFLGLKFHAFGMLVALAFIVGSKMALLYAKKHKLKQEMIHASTNICLTIGLLSAHLFHVIAYEPASLMNNPIRLLQVWSGISSYGGFIGAAVGMSVYFRYKKIKFLPYADALTFGLLIGWLFGRTGCFTAHDHPGLKSDFFLAVQYPGGARHDLGLYELLLTFPMLGLFLLLWKKGYDRVKGFLFSITVAVYAVIRFFLEFLRANDTFHVEARYFNLTPAQYISILCVLVFAFYSWKLWKNHSSYEKKETL